MRPGRCDVMCGSPCASISGAEDAMTKVGRNTGFAKLSSAARRRWFERRLARTEIEPYQPLAHVGTEYGGWWIPGDMLTPEPLCYSIGAGADVSFDLELIRLYGASVRAFDPFWIFREQAERQAAGERRYSFHEVAVTVTDGPVEMYGRQDEEQGSVSAVNLYGATTAFTKPGRSIASLMSEFGESSIDLLKMDVEGSEYDLLDTLDLRSIGVRVLCVEFHHNEPVKRAHTVISNILDQNFSTVARKDPMSFTFVRRC